MSRQHEATDLQIDALFYRAALSESAGALRAALVSLREATERVESRGGRYQYLYEWRARLEGGVGEHARAEASLMIAREIARLPVEGGGADDLTKDPGTAWAGDRLGVFRMDVARAELATSTMDLQRAEGLLSALRDDAEMLGPITVDRCAAIVAWLRALHFERRTTPNLAIPRVEAALAIASVWAEQGKYRSALRLVEVIEPDLAEAETAIRVEQVQLFEAELRLEAGQVEHARARLASMAPADDAVDWVRRALVRARISLTAGRLRDAYEEIADLAQAPVGDPGLFAAATVTRAAVLIELNLWRAAQDVATRALGRLRNDPAAAPLACLVSRIELEARARGASARAVWEFPVRTSGTRMEGRDIVGGPDQVVAQPSLGRPSIVTPGDAAGASSRLTSRWTSHANQVLESLEHDDLSSAVHHQSQLEVVTSGVESDYIAARVRLSALLIAYCREPSVATLEALGTIANELRGMGARGAEGQATRYAAWAAAKLGRRDDYMAFAHRSSAIIDEIASELPPVERALYLTNKWSGRDERVAIRMRELMDPGPSGTRVPTLRAMCRAFREINLLTHWPIDHAFGDPRAEELLSSTSDAIVPWVREQLMAPAPNLRGGFRMCSPLSLWRLPARTLVLHYYTLPDRTYLFRLARGHIDVVTLPIGRLHLRTDMRAMLGSAEALTSLAAQTGVAGALERFPDIQRLVIVPHDAIASVPFAALPIRDEPLCARGIAITQLDRLERLRRRRWFRRSGRTISVGLSSYQGSGYCDLPAAEREATSVAALAGADLWTGPDATCDQVRNALRTAHRVHVAAHGIAGTPDPSQAGIVLRDGDGHGLLTLHQLRRERFRRLALVSLATCRSAESAFMPGGERICLPTALLDAGARGVIAALWRVDDEPSVEVMTTLYRRLQVEPPSLALVRTQAELRRRPADQWAGLAFYGND